MIPNDGLRLCVLFVQEEQLALSDQRVKPNITAYPIKTAQFDFRKAVGAEVVTN
jgi:hypothetical protein